MQSIYDDFTEEFVTSGSKHSNAMLDWVLILVTTLLFAMGLISIYSATYDAGMSEYFTKQLLFGIVGGGVMIAIMFMPERWLFDYAYILYGIAMLLLIAVIVIGKTVYGSKSWLTIGPITFQPSEFGKIATLLAVARSISSRGRDLSNWSDLIMPIILFVIPIGLIMLEPDFGSASVYGVMLLGMMFWGGASLNLITFLVGAPISVIMGFIGREWVFVSSIITASVPMFLKRDLMKALAMLLVFIAIGFSSRYVYGVLKPHQQSRIQTFLNPDNDPRGRGYHVIQSIMAVGSGGVTGKGFLHGTQTQLRYIPKQWTDFIFCVPTEEFGFVGGVLVIGLLAILILQCIAIARQSGNAFGSILSASVGIIFFYHATVNIGMAIGAFPVMGIPLPFLSAGGSALVMNMASVGIVLNVYRNRRKVGRKHI
ncbi:MAG: rod shape-determining protein RodA [Ignavibacteria bacterium]|jgi:rod shape determining protein RodA